MKKLMAILMTIAIATTFVACGKKETKAPEKEASAEQTKAKNNELAKETEVEPEAPQDTTTVSGNSSFNFDVPEINFLTPEPVSISDARIDIAPEDFEFNISLNLSESDRARISGLSDEEIKVIAETKVSFLNDLIDAMKKENIDVKMDEVSGEMVMDATILFDVDKSEVSSEGKEFLKKFIPAYASVVSKDKYKNFIAEVTVEGHTDTQGSYDYNKTLSENRANSVANYILSNDINISDTERDLFEKLVKAYGRSYDEPIKDSSGKVDMGASRRVTFGFLISID